MQEDGFIAIFGFCAKKGVKPHSYIKKILPLQPLKKNLINKSKLMYAIVEIGGPAAQGDKKLRRLYVNRLESEEGTNLEFDKVLLVDNGAM